MRKYIVQTHSITADYIREDAVAAAGAGGLTDSTIDPVACTGVDPRIRVLSGGYVANPGWPDGEFDNGNNQSLIICVDFGEASFLFTGDMEETTIETLVNHWAGTGMLDVDVWEVGHHGSHNGVTPPLMAAMTPEVAVISMGAGVGTGAVDRLEIRTPPQGCRGDPRGRRFGVSQSSGDGAGGRRFVDVQRLSDSEGGLRHGLGRGRDGASRQFRRADGPARTVRRLAAVSPPVANALLPPRWSAHEGIPSAQTNSDARAWLPKSASTIPWKCRRRTELARPRARHHFGSTITQAHCRPGFRIWTRCGAEP